MTAGSGERQQAPYGRALWDADKKAKLFAEVVKTTEMAKSAGLLEQTKKTGRASRPCGSMPVSPGPASM